MPCAMGGELPFKSSGVNQKKFSAEMSIHFLGLKDNDKPTVWVFPGSSNQNRTS